MGLGGMMERDCHFHVSHSQPWVCSHWYRCKGSFLTLYRQQEHGSWIPTWFLVTACTTDIHTTSGIIIDRGPRTSAWTSAAAQTVDINTDLGSSMGHRHLHDFRWQCRPQEFTRPSVVTWARDVNMASYGSTDHGHQFCSQLQHEPQTPSWPSNTGHWLQHGLQLMTVFLILDAVLWVWAVWGHYGYLKPKAMQKTPKQAAFLFFNIKFGKTKGLYWTKSRRLRRGHLEKLSQCY